MARPAYPALFITLACFQNFLSSGIIFGWASISQTMLTTPEHLGGCGLDAPTITSIFTYASFMNFASPIVLGVILDRYGPRFCSILSHVMVAAGFLLFGISSPSSANYFLPATMLIASGGPGVQNSIIHLGNLYPHKRSLVTSLITGAFSLSFAIFSIFDIMWGYFNMSFRPLFLVYSLFVLFSAALSSIFWPDRPYNEFGEISPSMSSSDNGSPCRSDPPTSPPKVSPDEKTPLTRSQREQSKNAPVFGRNEFREILKIPLHSYLRPNQDGALTRSSSFLLSAAALESNDPAAMLKMSIKDQPFLKQLKSGSYWRLTLFFTVCSYHANFFIGTVGLQLGDSNEFSVETQHTFTRMFSFISSLGFVAMPAVGFLLDTIGFAFTASLTVMFGMCYTFFVLMQANEVVMYSCFVFYSLFRAFLFTYFFAALPNKMGFKYFGILAGITFLVAGIVQLSMKEVIAYAIGTCHLKGTFVEDGGVGTPDGGEECDGGNWEVVYYGQLISFMVVFVIPTVDTYLEKVQMNDMREIFGTPSQVRVSKPYMRGGPSGSAKRYRRSAMDLLEEAENSDDERSSPVRGIKDDSMMF